MSVRNDWLLYRKMREKVANQPEVDSLEFRKNMAKALLTSYGKLSSRRGLVHSLGHSIASEASHLTG